MFFVFAAFVPEGRRRSSRSIALGLAVGDRVDAFLVRMTLVPALMALFGKHAWWLPKWLDRILPERRHRGRGASHPPRRPRLGRVPRRARRGRHARRLRRRRGHRDRRTGHLHGAGGRARARLGRPDAASPAGGDGLRSLGLPRRSRPGCRASPAQRAVARRAPRVDRRVRRTRARRRRGLVRRRCSRSGCA